MNQARGHSADRKGAEGSALKLCWRCKPDLQGSKLGVQRVMRIWSSGERARLGVSMVPSSKEEPEPGMVLGGVPRR